MRILTPFNFGWTFARKTPEGTTEPVSVDLPHTHAIVPIANIDETSFQFVGVYRKTFLLEKRPDRRYFLRFESVLHRAEVLLNGIRIGAHSIGYSAFTLEATGAAKNGENVLVVETDARSSLDQPPFGKTVDYLTFGGIDREVTWIETPESRIVRVRLEKTANAVSNAFTLFLETEGGSSVELRILKDGIPVHEGKYPLAPETLIDFLPDPWYPDDPVLYQVRVSLDDDDEVVYTTGFRDLRVTREGFFLNGEKFPIVGLNRHAAYPQVGYAMPRTAQWDDARALKGLVNAVRTSHYPPSRHFLDACDSLGLLVFVEAPGWQHVGDAEWKRLYRESIGEMIREHAHHPSVILWGVRVNESGDDHDLYVSTNALAHSLDSRPTGGVRCIAGSEWLEDVYTYNDFHYNGENSPLRNPRDVAPKGAPYLITEFNGHMFPTKSFDPPEKQVEHALRYARVLDAALGEPRVLGTFGWSFVDYPTNPEFGSSDNVCHHGVCDMFRTPKAAAWIYRSQMEDGPVLELLNHPAMGDYDRTFIPALVIASNCSSIDVWQNERFVGTIRPRKDLFPHLPHPPFVLEDVIGEALVAEGLDEKTSKTLKAVGREVARRGGMDKLEPDDSFDPATAGKAWEAYGRHVANWGSPAFTYRFVGRFGTETLERKYGPSKTTSYRITPETARMHAGETYDVLRILIEAVDSFGNLRPYAFDAFRLKAEGSVALLGDDVVSLIAGRRAVWVRTLANGKGTLTIGHNDFTRVIDIDVDGYAIENPGSK